MRLLRAIAIVIILVTVGLVWFQKAFPLDWDRVLYPLEYETSIMEASQKYSIDPYLVCGIIYVESKFNPSSESGAGAIGLMQIMPATGKWIANKQGKADAQITLDDPITSIDMGTWYFRYLSTKYNNEKLALAAYNSGYKNVDRWLKERGTGNIDDMVANIPFEETRAFIVRVKSAQKMYEKLYPGEFDNLSSRANRLDK
ncbi:MAG TPA: lytic transglycosylase domain-containing protein [Candidatus Aquicultor sp.]|jgi:soluble lytic murein transglycosylase